MIAILCPTRGRAEQCRKMSASVLDTSDSAEILLRICVDDPQAENYSYFRNQIRTAVFGGMESTTAQKWNDLANIAMQNPDIKLFMLGSDDMYFDTPGWGKALLDHYNALENKIHVYALQDSRDVEGTPHPIVTREYIEALGYFVPPIFLHWHVDSWTVQIAKTNNCFTHMKDYLLVHNKPSDKGQADETHNRIRRAGWRERDQYVNDTCQHFLEAEKLRLAKAMT